MDNVGLLEVHRRRKKTGAAGAYMAALPEDVVFEILVRVDEAPALFRCAMACKPWRALVADLSFLHRRWPNGAHRRSSLLGFVAQYRHICATSIPRETAFIPAPQSPLGPGRCSLGSFFPHMDGLLDDVVPIIMRSGLLLVRLGPCNTTSAEQRYARLAVCNLLTGTCDVLPPLSCNVFATGTSKCVILAHTDYCSREQRPTPLPSYSTFFEVIIIFFEYSPEARYSMCTFSSANSSWSTPRCLHNMQHVVIYGNAVVCQGKVHWLTYYMGKFYTIEFYITTRHLSVIEFPIPPDYLHDSSFSTGARLTLTAGSKLSLVRLHTECLRLQIWTRQGNEDSSDDDAVRLHPKVIELKHKPPQNINAFYMHVGEKSGTLFVTDQHKFMCTVNLETGTTDEVTSMFYDMELYNLVPFEMDWPAFFMSRLEGTSTSLAAIQEKRT